MRSAGVWVAAVVAVALGACSSSDNKSASITKADKKELADKSCPEVTVPTFFSVELGGKTSYLLGTRHAGVRLDKFPPYVRDKVKGADVYIEESILDHAAFEWPKPKQPLSVALGDELWSRFKKLVGEDLATQVDHEAPIVAIALATLLWEDTDQRIDAELEGIYRAANKPVVALEDEARTKEIGATMLDANALASMLRAMPSRGAMRDTTAEDLAMYCRGDYDTPDARSPIRQMGLERNDDWIPKLMPYLDKGGALIAVGRDHVVSQGGLVDLLRRRGYHVQLVKP